MRGNTTMEVTVRHTTFTHSDSATLQYSPSSKVRISLFKLQYDDMGDPRGQWRVPMVLAYVRERGSWRKVASSRGKSLGWGSCVQLSEVDLWMPPLSFKPSAVPMTLPSLNAGSILSRLIVGFVLACPGVHLTLPTEKATVHVEGLSLELRPDAGSGSRGVERLCMEIDVSSINVCGSVKVTTADCTARVVVMSVKDHAVEGLMGRIISMASVDVDGVLVTSRQTQVALDKATLLFADGTGLLSIASASLRVPGPVPLRTSARSICAALAVFTSSQNVSSRALLKGLVRTVTLDREEVNAKINTLTLSMDFRVMGRVALKTLSRALRCRPLRTVSEERKESGSDIYDEYFAAYAHALPARQYGLEQALTVVVTGAQVAIMHSRSEILCLELAKVQAEAWIRLQSASAPPVRSIHSYFVAKVLEDAVVGIDKGGAPSPLLRLSDAGAQDSNEPLLLATCARYLLANGTEGSAFYKLRVEPLGHLTVFLDQVALLSFFHALKERCLAGTSGHTGSGGSDGAASPQVATLVQPFAVVVQLGGRFARDSQQSEGKKALVVPFPQAHLRSAKDAALWIIKALFSDTTSFSRRWREERRLNR